MLAANLPKVEDSVSKLSPREVSVLEVGAHFSWHLETVDGFVRGVRSVASPRYGPVVRVTRRRFLSMKISPEAVQLHLWQGCQLPGRAAQLMTCYY